MKTKITATLPLITWLTCETILQIHGIRFWIEYGGWCGWIWSVALGVACIWFWMSEDENVRRYLGTIASLMLLAGPLYQVGSPIVAQIEQRHAQQNGKTLQLETLRQTENALAETLRTYQRNSLDRSGWAIYIDKASDQLAQTRAQIAELTISAPQQRQAWLSIAVNVVQVITLCVLQIAAVLALLAMRGNDHKKVTVARTVAVQRPATDLSHPTDQSDQAAIAHRIASGHYGDKPAIRRVVKEEGRSFDVVKPIFEQLESEHKLRQVGNRYHLV